MTPEDHDTKVMSGRRDLDATVHIPTLHPGEPFFLLRGQDSLAAHAVKFWCTTAMGAGVDAAVIEQAMLQAERLGAWPNKKLPDTGHLTEQEAKQFRYQFSRRAYKHDPVNEFKTESEVLAFQRGYDLAVARLRRGEIA